MAKLEMQDYINCLQAKKQEAHDKQWLSCASCFLACKQFM